MNNRQNLVLKKMMVHILCCLLLGSVHKFSQLKRLNKRTYGQNRFRWKVKLNLLAKIIMECVIFSLLFNESTINVKYINVFCSKNKYLGISKRFDYIFAEFFILQFFRTPWLGVSLILSFWGVWKLSLMIYYRSEFQNHEHPNSLFPFL